jgi:hypothetical protein
MSSSSHFWQSESKPSLLLFSNYLIFGNYKYKRLINNLLFCFHRYCYQYRRGTSAASSSMLVSSSTAGLKPPNMQKASLATTMTETTAKSGDVGGLAERKNINGAGK